MRWTAVGWSLYCGVDATRLVVLVTCGPSANVDVVAAVIWYDPHRGIRYHQVPNAPLLKLGGPWKKVVTEVVQVQLCGGEEEWDWERDALAW